jgi:fumarylpyruvate hydrolase
MIYAIPAPPQRSLAIAGSAERFPVNRVFCVGRNYAAHAVEMGSDPTREPPFFFMKPSQATLDVDTPRPVPYPSHTSNYQHELELVVAIGVGGKSIERERALEHVFGFAIGLDMTRRDLQLDAREHGRPWEFAKSFASSAPIGAIHRLAETGPLASGALELRVNGKTRQSSDLSKRIWSVEECIAQLSDYDALEPGDLLMTGTPEGVSAVLRGDVLVGSIAGLGSIEVTIE